MILYEYIIAGSKGEGTTSLCESDMDVMYVLNDVICADDISPFRNTNDRFVFETDSRDTAPGYTKLRLCRFNVLGFGSPVNDSLVKSANGQSYCSSDLFFDEFKSMNIIAEFKRSVGRSGPSEAKVNPFFSSDSVGAFRCINH